MKAIRLIAIDKVRERYLAQGCDDYAARIRRYLPLDIMEMRPERVTKEIASEVDRARRREGGCLQKALSGRETLWVAALDIRGQSLSSERFAQLLLERFDAPSLPAFVIGGAFGLDESVLEQADFRFSLSALTLTHELARLVLLEQLYRALTILHGEKYHK